MIYNISLALTPPELIKYLYEVVDSNKGAKTAETIVVNIGSMSFCFNNPEQLECFVLGMQYMDDYYYAAKLVDDTLLIINKLLKKDK